MTLSVWDPFRTFGGVDRAFDSFLANGFDTDAAPVRAWRPATDLAVVDGAYVMRVELPGIPRDAIDVRVEDGTLTVSGEKKHDDAEEKNGKVYRRETRYGRFVRSFRLPEDADPDGVSADYTDGVLEIRIAKTAALEPRRIPIGNA